MSVSAKCEQCIEMIKAKNNGIEDPVAEAIGVTVGNYPNCRNCPFEPEQPASPGLSDPWGLGCAQPSSFESASAFKLKVSALIPWPVALLDAFFYIRY